MSFLCVLLGIPVLVDSSSRESHPLGRSEWMKLYGVLLDRVDEAGNLYFDGSNFPWKLADDFEEDKRWGYPRWKVLLGKLTGKNKG